MPNFGINTFRGEKPRLRSHLLEAHNATKAVNCSFKRANLAPLNGFSIIKAVPIKSGTRTLYRGRSGDKDYWFSWTEEVSAINSPIANDKWGRVYFSINTGPNAGPHQVTSLEISAAGGQPLPVNSRPLGIEPPKKPLQSLTLIPPASPAGAPGVAGVVAASKKESRYYVFTWVSDTGEESAPSPVSDLITLDPSKNGVRLSFPAITIPAHTTKIRIYRTATAGGTTRFQLVGEIKGNPPSLAPFEDKAKGSQLGPMLASQNHFPPSKKMKGISLLPNGIVAGFYKNVFCPSEVNLPYAYNPNNQLVTDWDIVAIGALPSGAVITTKGNPYLLQGYTPDSFNLLKLETSAACTNARSLVDMGSSVIYASGRGLMLIKNGEPRNITDSMITKEQWQAMNPASIEAYQYAGLYVGFYDNGKEKGGFIIDPEAQDMTMLDFHATAGYRLPEKEELYLVLDGENSVKSFDKNKAAPLITKWISKEFQTPPVKLRAAKVRGQNIALTLIRDGKEVKTYQLGSDYEHVIKLPKGRGQRWKVGFEGVGHVENVSLGSSVKELD